MNRKKYIMVPLVLMCQLLTSCFDKFDPESYKPTFTINGFTAVDEIKPSNLVAYWSFDGALTETVSGTTGTNKGSGFVNGFKGQAINFDGAAKTYATFEAPAALKEMKSFTISFWVNPTLVDTDGNNENDGILGLFGLSNASRFWGNIEWFVENGSKADGARIKIIFTSNNADERDILVENVKNFFGSWSNHTVTFDATTGALKYYVNGSLAGTKTVTFPAPFAFANSGPVVFGTVQFQTTPSLTSSHGTEPWASWLTGAMDEVRVYNTPLTQTEVNAMVVLQGKGK
ncbi:MAG TPA: LamG domain-containing protein [Chryseosolibacter sp.]